MKELNLVHAQASPKSIGGKSIFDAKHITPQNVMEFHSEDHVIKAAINKLKDAGFNVHPTGNTTIGISGTAEVYNKTFGIQLKLIQTEIIGFDGKKTYQQRWINTYGNVEGYISTRNSALSDVIEGIALAIPYEYYENPLPPDVDYWHLNPPGDISLLLNADRAHRNGYTGKNIRVTLVDSGFYMHPYYKERGYNINPVARVPFSNYRLIDYIGHGTAISANLFAIAPDCIFTMVHMFYDSILAFNTAAEYLQPKPDIISCSWGHDIKYQDHLTPWEIIMEATIANAINKNIIVVFAAGNGHEAFPGQLPDVIAAGGAYLDEHNVLSASSYASSFESSIYDGRNVPDICGLVGPAPKGIYIMLPVPSHSYSDRDYAGEADPHFPDLIPPFDNTTSVDGWIAASGTSSAAPQIAGICALMRQKNPELSPQNAKAQLMRTAKDVTSGRSSVITGSKPATEGIDLATGSGLANAWEAVRRLGEITVDSPINTH